MSQIMDLPPDLCAVINVDFFCDTWEEFDRTVAWVLKQGVRLTRWDRESDNLEKLPVVVVGRTPKWKGEIVNVKLGESAMSFDGEEGGARYSVLTPSVRR